MKRFVQTVGWAVVALLLLHGGPAIAAESRIALVIGNSSYAEAPLANPVNDARLMSETVVRFPRIWMVSGEWRFKAGYPGRRIDSRLHGG